MKTAKVRVTVELEIPYKENDETIQYNGLKAVLCQEIFSYYHNYALVSHLRDCTKWLSKSKDDEKSTEYSIYKHHDAWATILKKSTFNVDIL